MTEILQRTLLCFGDSNTHGTRAMRFAGDRRRHDMSVRWPSVLEQALGDGWNVVAEGHPGRTTVLDDPIEGKHKNSLRVLQAVLESHRPLDVVVIMLGTNDLKARFGMLASDVALGVQRVAGEILRSDCGRDGAAPSVLIVAPVSVTETGVFTEIFAGAQEKSQDLPRHLSQVAEALGVPFADTNTVARTDPTDGIHLDEQAHIAIGQYLAAQVSAM